MNKSCIFYNQSLLSDIPSFKIFKQANSNEYIIKYDNSDYSDVPIQENIGTFLQSHLQYTEEQKNIWQPLIIPATPSVTKPILLGFPIDTQIIGIEKALSFIPTFNNWVVTGNHSMTTDWIVNSITAPFVPIYGLLCWYKYNSFDNQASFDITTVGYNSSIQPVSDLSYKNSEDKTISINRDTKVIKKSDSILLIANENKISITTEKISPNINYKYFNLIEYLNYINKDIIDETQKTKLKDIKFISTDRTEINANIFISSGEAFSYNELGFGSTLTNDPTSSLYIDSKTYLSPTLFDKYRKIYNVLTLRYKKSIINKIPQPLFSKRKNRLFKKLCYFLSTYPQIDRTTVSILQSKEIFDIVEEFTNKTSISRDTELAELVLVLQKISAFFVSLSTETNNQEDPIIYVANSLLKKYGSRLYMEGNCSLRTKDDLPYGPHLRFTSDLQTSSSSLQNDGGILYNNMSIQTGPYSVSTQINESAANLSLTSISAKKPSIIPLWDIKKKELIQKDLFLSIGPDIEIDFNDVRNRNITNLSVHKNDSGEIFFDIPSILSTELQETVLAGTSIIYTWSKILGSNCLKFSNKQLSTISNNGIFSGSLEDLRFDESPDLSPTIYIKRPGKYIIQCVVSTPFGFVSDTVNIYITAESENEEFSYTRSREDIPRQKREVSILPAIRQALIIPNIREFIIGKQGIFYPINSDVSLYEPKYITVRGSLPGTTEKRRVGNTIKSLGSSRNKFLIPHDEQYNNDLSSNLVLSFDCQNTIMHIGEIRLSHIYDTDNPFCESIYNETIDNRLEDLDLEKYKIVIDTLTNKDIKIERPYKIKTNEYELTTTSVAQISKIINGSSPNADLIFNEFKYTDDIYSATPSGYQGSPFICYEDMVYDIDQNLTDRIMVMDKGYFHPSSGWIKNTNTPDTTIFKNRTSIMIGDHSKKNCKSFRGLGFHELTNDFEDGLTKIYSSSITISLDPTAYSCTPTDSDTACMDKETKKFNDHDTNHGYRDVSTLQNTIYKYTPELIIKPKVIPDGPIASQDYCIDNIQANLESETNILYKYPKPGPVYIDEFRIDPSLKFDREIGRTIEDIEIQLNFLNYINPKELVVWLEITPPEIMTPGGFLLRDEITKKTSLAQDIWFGEEPNIFEGIEKINSIENTSIKNYTDSLFKMNTIDVKNNHCLYLYLLNQDYIDANTYNSNIKFSDNTTDISYNINIDEYKTNQLNTAIINNSILEIQPTKTASGYNDLESNVFKTIIHTNNLYKYLGANFSKFYKLPLFSYEEQDLTRAPDSSDITFTLKIAIVGESDNTIPHDRIINTDQNLNIVAFQNQSISSISTNSLCCWDLILSNSKKDLNYVDKDVYGYIDYNNNVPGGILTNSFAPKYYGYNYICKIPSDIIPPVNINAPNNFINNKFGQSACIFPKKSLTIRSPISNPTLNLTPYRIMPPNSLVSALVSMSLLDQYLAQNYNELANWVSDIMRVKLSEQFNAEVYTPIFDTYSTGHSNMALMSISKDKKIWFKLEAGILRYNNCPVLQKVPFSYKHIHFLNEFSEICKFPMRVVDPTTVIKYKVKNIIPIILTNPNYINYNLTEVNITNLIKDKILLSYVKTTINNIKSIIDNLSSTDIALNEYNSVLNRYISLYNSIGVEGIIENDIISITSKTEDGADAVTYYTISAPESPDDNQTLVVTVFDNIYDLCNKNNTIFYKNNLLFIYPYLKISNAKNIVIVEGLRPYSIFEVNKDLDIYTLKTILTDAEQVRLDELEILLTDTNDQLQVLISNYSNGNRTQSDTDSFRIDKKNLESTIINYKNEIFLITHEVSTHRLIDKGTIFDGTKYNTIFVFPESSIIPESSVVVIKPDQNRIIIYDDNYTNKNSINNSTINQWSHTQPHQISTAKIDRSLNSSYTSGTYGSGTNTTDCSILYNQEIINYIKDFIKYISVNNLYRNNFSIDCQFINYNYDSSRITNQIKNIYCYDIYNLNLSDNKYDSFIIMRNKNQSTVIDPLSQIMGTEKFNAFLRNKGLTSVIEGSAQNSIEQYSGDETIEFKQHIRHKIIYGFPNGEDSLDTLKNRLSVIPSLIEQYQTLISALSDSESDRIVAKDYKQNIHKLHLEFNKISFYIENIENNHSNTLPNIELIVTTLSDQSLSIEEKFNNDHYFINIDAEQGCSLDIDNSIKILHSIRYECLQSLQSDTKDRTMRFCSPLAIGQLTANNTFDIRTLTGKGEIIIYTMTDEKKEQYISEYSSIQSEYQIIWDKAPNYFKSRTFFLKRAVVGEGNMPIIVKATYNYILPRIIRDVEEGERVKDIINLDSTEKLYTKFRQIPRNIRNADEHFDKSLPNADGQLTKSTSISPSGPPDATFKTWNCIDTKTGQLIELPDNFKWMNFMIYTAFFNNYLISNPIDINRGLKTLRSRDEMELIPYDYE